MTNKLRAFFVFVSFFVLLPLLFLHLGGFSFWPFLVAATRGRLGYLCVFFAVAVAAAVAALMALVITFNCHCKVFASHQKWQRLSADSIARLALTRVASSSSFSSSSSGPTGAICLLSFPGTEIVRAKTLVNSKALLSVESLHKAEMKLPLVLYLHQVQT